MSRKRPARSVWLQPIQPKILFVAAVLILIALGFYFFPRSGTWLKSQVATGQSQPLIRYEFANKQHCYDKGDGFCTRYSGELKTSITSTKVLGQTARYGTRPGNKSLWGCVSYNATTGKPQGYLVTTSASDCQGSGQYASPHHLGYVVERAAGNASVSLDWCVKDGDVRIITNASDCIKGYKIDDTKAPIFVVPPPSPLPSPTGSPVVSPKPSTLPSPATSPVVSPTSTVLPSSSPSASSSPAAASPTATPDPDTVIGDICKAVDQDCKRGRESWCVIYRRYCVPPSAGSSPKPTLPTPEAAASPTPRRIGEPTVKLNSREGTSVAFDTRATLTWASRDASKCTASGGWRGSKPENGSEQTARLQGDTTFAIICTGPRGVASDTITIKVAGSTNPAVDLRANGKSASIVTVSRGQSATLTWTSQGTAACSASGNWSGTKKTSGSFSTGALNSDATFVITCRGEDEIAPETSTDVVVIRVE